MSDILKLTSPIPPSVNHYLGTRAIIKSGKPMAMVYETKEAKEYKKWFNNYIKSEVIKQNWKSVLDPMQHYYCDCTFYFDRIDKDCNNYFKLLLDSITESQTVWVDDNVVCERVNRIYYDSKNPRIEIDIYPVEYIGIFNNRNQLNDFEAKCKFCNRYKRNCSIFKKAKEGRIQEEINEDLNCQKYKDAKKEK